jgi:hypothetical protein
MPKKTFLNPVSYLGRGISTTRTAWVISPDASEPANAGKQESWIDQRFLDRLESIDRNTATIRRIMVFWSGVALIGALLISAWFANH